MRKTVHKIFWIEQFDKEENWLNEMADSGWALIRAGYGKYDFEEGAPAEYCVRLEFLERSVSSEQSRDYIRFMEETGAEYVGHRGNWCYFRKKRTEGEFEIFSDLDSRIKHLSRIEMIPFTIILTNLCCLFTNLNSLAMLVNWMTLSATIICLIYEIYLIWLLARIHRKKKKLIKQREITEN